MAIPDTIITDSDVLDAAGGPVNLAQLIDKDGSGVPSPDTLLAARRSATIEVLGMVEVQSQLDGLSPPYPRLWVQCARWLAVLYYWLSGAQGQAFPPHYQREVDNVRQTLLPLIRTGKAGNVADQGTVNNQTTYQVTHNSAFRLDRMKGLY